jgi:hypothetical protein
VAKRLRVSDDIPSEFWLTNPTNDMIGNSAAGGQGAGIWWDFGYTDNFNVWNVTDKDFGIFDNNIAHSHTAIDDSGSHVDSTGIMIDNYRGNNATRHAANNNSAWKNANFGFWTHGLLDFVGSTAANNNIAITAEDMYVAGGVMVGKTANTGSEIGVLGGLVRFYHGQADVENVWLGGFQDEPGMDQAGMTAFSDNGAGITDFENRIRNIKFFGSGWRVQHVFCGTRTTTGECYFGPSHGGNGHYLVDLDGSVMGDGVPAIITNGEAYLRHAQSKIIYPSVSTYFYGTANRGLWTPNDRKFMALAMDPETDMMRDDDGTPGHIRTWTLTEMGRRYHILDSRTSFSIHSTNPGWIELYFDKATAPASVNAGGYNSDQQLPQKKASSLANLGVDGKWWWENGKLYIRPTVTGTTDPFGKAGAYTSISTGAGYEYWSIR